MFSGLGFVLGIEWVCLLRAQLSYSSSFSSLPLVFFICLGRKEKNEMEKEERDMARLLNGRRGVSNFQPDTWAGVK